MGLRPGAVASPRFKRWSGTDMSRLRLLAATVLSIVLAALAGESAWPADSVGEIRGRVDVRIALAPPEPRPNVSDLATGRFRGTPDRRTSVVYLEAAPRGAFETPSPRRAVLDQRAEAFWPYVLAITVGSTVDFPNSDPIFHNVFSLSSAKSFDLGRYPKGQSRSVRFTEPGVVRVFCDIHSHMSAFILVFAHPFFAVTDAEGRYRIERVPPGRYALAVWTDGQVRESKPVEVVSGTATDADFAVR
jgi:plastocyanin